MLPTLFIFLIWMKKTTEGWAKPAIPAERIDALLEQGLLGNQDARQWAVFTLGQLHFLGLLTHKQRERFADVLWGRLDDAGFPDQNYNRSYYYYKFGFVDLPHPRRCQSAFSVQGFYPRRVIV